MASSGAVKSAFFFATIEYSTKYRIDGIAPIVPFLSHPLSSLCQ